MQATIKLDHQLLAVEGEHDVHRGRRIAGVEGDLEGLSNWAAGAKYPGLPEEAGEGDATRCLELARKIVDAARQDVSAEG